MYWVDSDADKPFPVPRDIVDVQFTIECKRLPVDHGYALAEALLKHVPWLAADPAAAVHSIHVAGSQNGWERPPTDTDSYLMVSRRTRLTIRVPEVRVGELRDSLEDRTLDIAGCTLTVREGKVRLLSKEPTLFARYVVPPDDSDESAFLEWVAAALDHQGIRMRKALCGKVTQLYSPEGLLKARSLLVADLTPEESIRLQQTRLGTHATMGCGVFIPHKGISSVKKDG